MNFFKFLNFSLKSTKIPVGLCFQLASVTINFTDNRDYRAVLYSMIPGGGPAVRYTKTNQIDVLRLNNPRTRNPGPVPEEKSGARLSVDRRGSL